MPGCARLCLVDLYRQTVGICEKGVTLAGEFIDADGLDGDSGGGQTGDGVGEGCGAEGEVAEAGSFGV
jgi:hypothetical protein